MSKNQPMAVPCHDVLLKMACDDPQAFESLRSTLIEHCIDSAADDLQPRLRRLQFRVDGIRRMSRSPLGAIIKIQSLMWDSFLQMSQELQRLHKLASSTGPTSGETKEVKRRPSRCARIIELRIRKPSVSG